MAEGELCLHLLKDQCKTINGPSSLIIRFYKQVSNLVNLHFQKLFRHKNYLPDEQFFERLWTPGELPNKARYLLNMLNDFHHAKRVVNALDGISKNSKQSANEEDWALYF